MGSNDPPGSSSVIYTSTSQTFSEDNPGLLYKHAAASLWVAFGVNLLIGAIKYVAWIFSMSPSVLSEALHSFGDAINSVALILGNHLSRKAPDRTHPFGYGLEANVWAMPASLFLLISSSYVIWHGWERLVHPPLETFVIAGLPWMSPFWFAVIVLVISIALETYAVHRASEAVLEEVQVVPSGFLDTFVKAYQNIRSVVSPTTRFVFWEDSLAWLGAFLALIAITISEYAVQVGFLPQSMAHWPDAITSMLIGLMLGAMGVYLFRHNRGVLTGTAASPKTEHRIRDLVMSLHGVSELLELTTLDRGLAGLSVHLKVEVEPYTLVKDVDDLTERIKERIQSRIYNASQVFVEVIADESEIEWGEKFNSLVEQGRKEGVLDARDEALLKNVYDFTELTVRDIMIPRIDVEYVDVETPFQEVADLMIESGHSRLPVFKENVDDLVGLIYQRDVFERIRKGEVDTPLSELVREIDIYPENKPISDLLEDFKRKKIRIAAVADEHGGFAGLVTVEDVIEEIIGELWDEHDEEEPMLTQLDPRKVMVNGRMEVEDLNEQLDLNIPFDDFKTVGGFVFGTLGHEPEPGDEAGFEDLRFIVTEVDGPRIVSVTIESPVPFEFKETQEDSTSNGNGH